MLSRPTSFIGCLQFGHGYDRAALCCCCWGCRVAIGGSRPMQAGALARLSVTDAKCLAVISLQCARLAKGTSEGRRMACRWAKKEAAELQGAERSAAVCRPTARAGSEHAGLLQCETSRRVPRGPGSALGWAS